MTARTADRNKLAPAGAAQDDHAGSTRNLSVLTLRTLTCTAKAISPVLDRRSRHQQTPSRLFRTCSWEVLAWTTTCTFHFGHGTTRSTSETHRNRPSFELVGIHFRPPDIIATPLLQCVVGG